jgi:uncharacterized protein
MMFIGGERVEEQVSITGAGVTLEGVLVPGAAPGGVVITHPHPLFGGSMANNVVWTSSSAFGARGMSTLRFNFRGVGRSTGSYGGGVEEAQDVAAALEFLKLKTPGPYYVVGYSFGAFVAGQALLEGLEVEVAIFISPPINFMDLSFLPQIPELRLIAVGDHDELCPLKDLESLLAESPTPPEVRVIQGADHFFGGAEDKLFQALREFPL